MILTFFVLNFVFHTCISAYFQTISTKLPQYNADAYKTLPDESACAAYCNSVTKCNSFQFCESNNWCGLSNEHQPHGALVPAAQNNCTAYSSKQPINYLPIKLIEGLFVVASYTHALHKCTQITRQFSCVRFCFLMLRNVDHRTKHPRKTQFYYNLLLRHNV